MKKTVLCMLLVLGVFTACNRRAEVKTGEMSEKQQLEALPYQSAVELPVNHSKTEIWTVLSNPENWLAGFESAEAVSLPVSALKDSEIIIDVENEAIKWMVMESVQEQHLILKGGFNHPEFLTLFSLRELNSGKCMLGIRVSAPAGYADSDKKKRNVQNEQRFWVSVLNQILH